MWNRLRVIRNRVRVRVSAGERAFPVGSRGEDHRSHTDLTHILRLQLRVGSTSPLPSSYTQAFSVSCNKAQIVLPAEPFLTVPQTGEVLPKAHVAKPASTRTVYELALKMYSYEEINLYSSQAIVVSAGEEILFPLRPVRHESRHLKSTFFFFIRIYITGLNSVNLKHFPRLNLRIKLFHTKMIRTMFNL